MHYVLKLGGMVDVSVYKITEEPHSSLTALKGLDIILMNVFKIRSKATTLSRLKELGEV